MAAETATRSTNQPDQLTLDLIALLPEQGAWNEQEYLWLSGRTNRLIEFSDGIIEVLPLLSLRHQKIVLLLYRLFFTFVDRHGLGLLIVAPLRVYLQPGKYREPDLMFLLEAHSDRAGEQGFLGADLVIEVVSPDDPERDLMMKRREYAQAGVPEYWIVDPRTEVITVLQLEGTQYIEHGVFARGTTATSALLTGFAVAVDSVFDTA